MFGSSGAFGGGSSGSNTGGGFGGFGQSNTNTSANRPGFGGFGQTSAPGTTAFGGASGGTTGFGSTAGNTAGGFGSTGAATGTFGQPSTTGGAFGQTRTTSGLFGGAATTAAAPTFGQSSTGGFGSLGGGSTGGALFGQGSSTGGGAFGSTSTFGGSAGAAAGMTNTGTGHTPFAAHTEVTNAGVRETFQHIGTMDAYKAFSTEELRLQDYLAGRKKAGATGAASGFGQSTTAGGFGQSASGTTGGFGAFGQTSGATGGFGSSGTGSTFGQPSTGSTGFGSFGSTSAAPTASGFGAGTTANAFGQPSTATGGFGQSSTSGFGGFGATASKPAFGASATTGFGQPSTSTAGFGGFGSTGTAASKPAFGQTPTGGFGQPAASTSGFGGFGATSAAAPATGFGATASTGGFGSTGFGNTAAATGGFGQPASTAGGFGATATPAKPAFGGGFGTAAASQPAASGGLFGQTGAGGAPTGFGQTATTGFGGGSTTGGGLFGGANTGTTAASTGGLFGAKPAAATGTGLFGTGTTTNTGLGGGLFGGGGASNATVATAGPTAVGSLFGPTNTGTAATTAGGGLFGGGASNTSASTGGGLFGGGLGANKPLGTPGGGLFGANTGAGSTGLFGGSNTAATSNLGGAAGGGLFGQPKPALGTMGQTTAATGFGAAGGGLFGPGTSSGGFGLGRGLQTQQQQQLQPNQLAAQIDRQPYGVNALFDTSKLAAKKGATSSSHLTATPLRAALTEQSTLEKEKELKKRGLSLHTLSSPLTANSSRLRARGFAAPNSTSKRASIGFTGGSAKSTPASLNAPGTPAAQRRETIALFGRDGFLSPDAQLPRSSVKRLVITRRPSFSNSTGSATKSTPGSAKSTLAQATASGSKVRADNESPLRNSKQPLSGILGSPPSMDNPWAELRKSGKSPAPSNGNKRRVSIAEDATSVAADEYEHEEYANDEEGLEQVEDSQSVAELSENEEEDEEAAYWMRPSLSELRAMPARKLRAVKDFTVGRTGVGQVRFLEAVNLTTVGSLSAIAGGVVLFDDRVCTVYPDESNKPPRGEGLNVPAVISLEDCWPVDRATRQPIVQVDDPRVRKHIRRLKSIGETTFIDFVEGTWVFRVEHFSRYGLDDDDDDDDDDDGGNDNGGGGGNSAVKASMSQSQQGFGKATAASAADTQSQLGGSRAVAQQPKTAATTAAFSFSAPSAATVASSKVMQGGRHAESLRRGPVMRASLFSTSAAGAERLPQSSALQTFGTAGKRSFDAAQKEPTAQTTASRGGFGRIQVHSPAIPFSFPERKAGASVKHSAKKGRRRIHKDHISHATTGSVAPTASASIDVFDLPPPNKYLRTNESRLAKSLLASPRPYSKSVTHGRSGLGADAGMMMARSFRVAFGPQGQLVYLQNSYNRSRDSSGTTGGLNSSIVIDNISRHVHSAPDSAATLAESSTGHADATSDSNPLEYGTQLHLAMVRAQWEHSSIQWNSSSPSACPAVSFNSATTIAGVVDSLTRLAEQRSVSLPSEECRILELASTLFDDLARESGEDELEADQKTRIHVVRRRQGLTKWLMAAVRDAVQYDLVKAAESKSPAAASVFALLSGHKVEAASLAAVSHRDYRLATLVSQCGSGGVGGGGSDKQVRSLIRAQIERLNATGSSDDMSAEYRLVYELLSGNVQWERQSSRRSSTNYVAAGIDWKRAFGLGLWYAQSPVDSISGAVGMYEAAFKQQTAAPIAAPLPRWLFSGANAGFASYAQRQFDAVVSGDISESQPVTTEFAYRAAELYSKNIWDPVYQLLKLYSEPSLPLERALMSESFTPARGDSRLPALLAWLLFVIRGCRGFEDAQRAGPQSDSKLVSIAYDRLLAGWAFQLECLGQWHWACYLLLQLSSDAHKVHAVRSLLERSLSNSLPTNTLPPAAAAAAELLPQIVPASGDASIDEVEERVKFVVCDLHLPKQWLYEAYSTRSRFDRDWIETRMATAQPAVPINHPVSLAMRKISRGRQALPSFFGGYAPSAVSSNGGGRNASSAWTAFRSESVATVPGLAASQLDISEEATLREVVWLLSAGRLASAHLLVLQRIAPDAVLRGDYQLLASILECIDPEGSGSAEKAYSVPLEDWECGGKVYMSFLAAVEDLPAVLKQIAAAESDAAADPEEHHNIAVELVDQVKRIYHRMVSLLSALPSLSARFDTYTTSKDAVRSGDMPSAAPVLLGFFDGDEAYWYSAEEARELRIKYSVAVSDMASTITGFIQEMESYMPLEDQSRAKQVHADTATLPLAQDMRILRTCQLAQSCFDTLVASGLDL